MFREREIRPEIREEEKVREFSPSQALIKEKSVLNKLWGKARNTGKILFWVGCFTAGPGYAYASGYSREAPPTVAAERVEAKKKDVRINKESLGVVAYIMAQARENLKERYPGDRNAMTIDGFGREVEALLDGLPDNGELIFKGDSTIVPDLSEAEERGKRVIFERIITKKTPSDVLPEVEEEVIEINHGQTVEIGKKEVAETRDEIGTVLKAGKGLEKGKAIREAKARAISEYWENTKMGEQLRDREVKEKVGETQELKNLIYESEDFKKFSQSAQENLSTKDLKYHASIFFTDYSLGKLTTERSLEEAIELSKGSKPKNAEELVQERRKYWDNRIQKLISDIEGMEDDFTKKYQIRIIGGLPTWSEQVWGAKTIETQYWLRKLGLDKKTYQQNRAQQLLQEMGQEEW